MEEEIASNPSPKVGLTQALTLAAAVAIPVRLWLRTAIPDINIGLILSPTSLIRLILSRWDPSRDLGIRTGFAIAYLPVSAWFTLMRWLHVPAVAAQQVWFIGLLFIGAFGMTK